ncbi:MAG: hypothetical protein CM15mV19_1050 [uncultured marine virus]|nr:MAG: hypothetical protein CM15mV19_1050 [uncultured marine virus]
MATNKNVKKAQTGVNVPPMGISPVQPQLDFMSFDEQFGGYTPPPACFLIFKIVQNLEVV